MVPARSRDPHAVILDIGNVLYKWDPHRVLAEQIPDDDERARFIDRADLFAWHATLDRGRGLAEAIHALSTSVPDYGWLIRRWGDLYKAMVEERIAGTIEIVGQLHARRVPLFIVSNFPAEFWPDFHRPRAALFDRFEDIVLSGDVGLAKPDPEIFELALRRFGLEPTAAIFVDDMQANVDAAAAAGLHTHRFETPDGLRTELKRLALL